MTKHMTGDWRKEIFLSAFLCCLGVFLLIVFRRNSFKLTVDSMVGVYATIQITKDEISIAINNDLIICIEIISSFIQRQQRVPHFCQHGEFSLSRITFRHSHSILTRSVQGNSIIHRMIDADRIFLKINIIPGKARKFAGTNTGSKKYGQNRQQFTIIQRMSNVRKQSILFFLA